MFFVSSCVHWSRCAQMCKLFVHTFTSKNVTKKLEMFTWSSVETTFVFAQKHIAFFAVSSDTCNSKCHFFHLVLWFWQKLHKSKMIWDLWVEQATHKNFPKQKALCIGKLQSSWIFHFCQFWQFKSWVWVVWVQTPFCKVWTLVVNEIWTLCVANSKDPLRIFLFSFSFWLKVWFSSLGTLFAFSKQLLLEAFQCIFCCCKSPWSCCNTTLKLSLCASIGDDKQIWWSHFCLVDSVANFFGHNVMVLGDKWTQKTCSSHNHNVWHSQNCARKFYCRDISSCTFIL